MPKDEEIETFEDLTPFERLERLAKLVLTTPKEEVDKRIEGCKREGEKMKAEGKRARCTAKERSPS